MGSRLTGAEYNAVMKTIRTMKNPLPGTIVDFVTHPDYYELRIYENQVMAMSINERMALMEHLQLLRTGVESYGVRCELGGAVGDPPNRVKVSK